MAWNLLPIGPEWDGRWDSLVKSTPESGFMQSSVWSEFKRLEGYETPRFGLFEGGALRGGAALLSYPAHSEEGFLVCPEGPIVPWLNMALTRDSLRMIARAAEDYADLHGGLGLRIEPRLSPPRPSILRNWQRAPVDLNPEHSLVIDLSVSPEQALQRMHPKGRYNIHLSERHGVTTTASTDMQQIGRFYPLFVETAARNGFFAEPLSFFINLASVLFPARMAHLVLASWQGETLAAMLMITFGTRATYLYGGSASQHRNVMPTYAMHWAAMQLAREMGCLEYDLYGYDPFQQPDHPYYGFSRFKRHFGGERLDMIGAHDLIFYERLAARLAERLAGGLPDGIR